MLNLRKNFIFKISFENFLIIFFYLLILFYSKAPFQSYNYIHWKFNLLIYLFFPSLSFFILSTFFKNKTVEIEIKREDILIGALFFFFSIFFHLKSSTLFADEIAYAYDSFLLVEIILNKFDFLFTKNNYLNTIPIRYIYQFISLIIWSFFILLVWWIISIKNYRLKIITIILSLALLRCLTFLLNYFVGPHPVLNYLFPNIFCSIFGLSEMGFKISIILFFLSYYILLINRLKFNISQKIFTLILILSINQISIWLFYFEQANYSYLAFLFFMIEVSFNKPKPKYLFLFVSISIWFRYVNIVLFIPTFIYSMAYYCLRSGKTKTILIKSITSSLPTIIALPCFYQIIFTGTPTTSTITNYNNLTKSFNQIFDLELLKISFINYDNYILFFLFLIISLIVRRNFLIITYLLIILFSYLTLFNLTDSGVNIRELKYSFEAIGFILVFGILYHYKTTKNNLMKYSFFLIMLLIGFFSKIFPDELLEHKVYKSNEIYNFIKVNRIIDEVYIHDYPLNNNFMLLLNGFNKLDIKKYNFNSKIYNKNKTTNWYTLDIETINDIKTINYLFASSINGKGNLKYHLNSLEKNLKWKKILFLSNFINMKDITLFKRI